MAAVDPIVLTQASKQRPKRLVLVGDDERSYGFLVKGGEDVRGDERIEQLFEAMNAVMAQGERAYMSRSRARSIMDM